VRKGEGASEGEGERDSLGVGVRKESVSSVGESYLPKADRSVSRERCAAKHKSKKDSKNTKVVENPDFRARIQAFQSCRRC